MSTGSARLATSVPPPGQAADAVQCQSNHRGTHAEEEDEFSRAVYRMLCGDEDAFRWVFRAVQPGLVRYLTVLIGAGDADDVASETWAQAVRDLHRFTGDGDGFRGWITTIGRHRALDHVRAAGRRPVVDTRIEQLPDPATGQDAETGALESLSTQGALALIASLPPDQAEAVLLRTVLGLDAKTAGQVLNKRPGAVRTAAYRGLRSLAHLIEQPLAPAVTPAARTDASNSDILVPRGAEHLR